MPDSISGHAASDCLGAGYNKLLLAQNTFKPIPVQLRDVRHEASILDRSDIQSAFS